MQKVYLDTCCLNRPFDDQSQVRVRLESEAILHIIERCTSGELRWVASNILDFEIGQTQDADRRERVHTLRSFADDTVTITASRLQRSQEIEALGISKLDARHIACAEQAQVDAFLTTDDRLLKLTNRFKSHFQIAIENPLTWISDKR
ncbi:MAG: PIN domain-containing protein [Chloroflexi bacterium]|nr:PIN domain-containing protein [Chloroflexota bacterium]